jgi:hypothetical protein
MWYQNPKTNHWVWLSEFCVLHCLNPHHSIYEKGSYHHYLAESPRRWSFLILTIDGDLGNGQTIRINFSFIVGKSQNTWSVVILLLYCSSHVNQSPKRSGLANLFAGWCGIAKTLQSPAAPIKPFCSTFMSLDLPTPWASWNLTKPLSSEFNSLNGGCEWHLLVTPWPCLDTFSRPKIWILPKWSWSVLLQFRHSSLWIISCLRV